MTPERWQHIKDLVNSAMHENPETRTAFLQQSCTDDLPLRLGAEALLALHEDATRKLPEVAVSFAPDQWQRIEQIFQSALELEPAERAAYLQVKCGDDAALRHEVESLLVYQAAAGNMIHGAIHNAAGLLADTTATKARFTPGTTLNKRYRIIGLLGKGGMGEVYRADDLKLGQPVALKFLTEKLSQDKAMLARFHSEVSMAHRVTHPNVCRVHDIGEVTTSSGNLHFLSMEFVDGEDLSSLLRRIGRLPSDKAVELANQLCAGLAAAHEAGVLHRDLKPANVMIDGKGRVRITDFGLAGFAEQIKGNEVFAGTPAYMSPEQFASKEVTAKSDIYALGLVLYEIFTGKRVFEGNSLEELRSLHESSSPTNPSNWVKDIDPLVERVILRCLEKDPTKRLSSAKQVADALPGGDPLAAALALGETPSPEMVAAAGSKTGMKPLYAVVCLLAIIIGMVLVAYLNDKASAIPRLLREHSPEDLQHIARDLTQQLGYTERPLDSATGIYMDFGYINYINQNLPFEKRYDQFTNAMSPVSFWYRQSPQYLQSWLALGRVTESAPEKNLSGMVNIWFDLQGRLRRFEANPPQIDKLESHGGQLLTDWTPLFVAARLDHQHFTQTKSQWLPPANSDERVAWVGTHPSMPDFPLRIEAAAYRGKPIYFQLIWPWSRPERMTEYQSTIGQRMSAVIIFSIVLLTFIGAVLLARYNFRQGRGDRRGAFKLAVFIFVATLISWGLGANHRPDETEIIALFLLGVSPSLMFAALGWFLYVALEPYIRKRWPVILISWNRLLSGGLRDPLVNRDILLGILFGIWTQALYLNEQIVNTASANSVTLLSSLSGLRFLIADGVLFPLYGELLGALVWLFLLFLLRSLTRRDWLMVVVFVAIMTGLNVLAIGGIFYGLLVALRMFLLAIILLRLGFVTYVIGEVVANLLMYPITLHFSAWYTSYALMIVCSVLILATYAFYSSLGGQKVFTGKLLEE